RYNLDQIPLALRDTVIFRIAFGSNGDNPSGRALNGFAFDDIYIGEKNKNVLVEHFTNVNSTSSNQANVYLEDLYRDQITNKDSSDFIPIQYHVANPGFDQLNADNPQDPIARSLLYGVSQPPTTIMDGIQDSYFNGFTAKINEEELDRRALEDASFDIRIDTIAGPGTNDVIRLAITYTYVDSLKPLNTPVTLHAALIERGINGTGNGNVVRKLLLQSEGRTLTRSWVKGDTEIANIQYAIDVPIVDPDSLYILGFVQEKDQVLDSRKILQAAIVKSNRKKGITIVGLPDDPITGELADLSIYPNPASNYLNITVGGDLDRKYNWILIDQRGITILSGELNQEFSSGPQRIDVSGIANGIYFMAIQTGDKSVVHRKIAVMNRN
ncbi:MAG: T9SS type A sorting domain-containing protein, partial [Cyclobacteriaceae bacterium]|nr:T9SS type A sorting domain-containing protein [Cyclobacteriaceae bacterium]